MSSVESGRGTQEIKQNQRGGDGSTSYRKLIGRHRGRSVEMYAPERKELGHPAPKLTSAEKAAIRKQIRANRRQEQKQQIDNNQAAPAQKINSGNIYDIVLEVAALAEDIDAVHQPELARNMSQLLSNLLKIIDEYHEREAERQDEERELDRREDEMRRKERIQKKHADNRREQARQVQEDIASRRKKPRE